jgi:hypothetical protein
MLLLQNLQPLYTVAGRQNLKTLLLEPLAQQDHDVVFILN